MLCGLPVIDIDDWRSHCDYKVAGRSRQAAITAAAHGGTARAQPDTLWGFGAEGRAPRDVSGGVSSRARSRLAV